MSRYSKLRLYFFYREDIRADVLAGECLTVFWMIYVWMRAFKFHMVGLSSHGFLYRHILNTVLVPCTALKCILGGGISQMYKSGKLRFLVLWGFIWLLLFIHLYHLVHLLLISKASPQKAKMGNAILTALVDNLQLKQLEIDAYIWLINVSFNI